MGKPLRVAVDLDGTLVGFIPDSAGREILALRPDAPEVLADLKRAGHTLILWTLGNRRWWQEVLSQFPILARFFDEVYTRDDEAHHVTQGRGFPEPVKDIREIRADMLVDNDRSHYEWAKRHGLAERYFVVETFGAG